MEHTAEKSKSPTLGRLSYLWPLSLYFPLILHTNPITFNYYFTLPHASNFSRENKKKNEGGKLKKKKKNAVGKLRRRRRRLWSDTEILSPESLTELPISWCHVQWGGSAPIAARDPERERLAHKNRIGLPVLAPVPAHADPASLRSFHADAHDVSCARDVGDQYQVKVTEAVDCESDSSLLSAWDPVKNTNQRMLRGQ